MTKWYNLFLALFIISSFLHGWRTWYKTDLGANIAGIGNAYVSTLDIPSASDIQPASTGFGGKPIIVWDILTTLTLVDPFSGQYSLIPDPLPFVGFSLGNSSYGIGFSLRKIIQAKGSDLAVYKTGGSIAFLLLPYLRIGGFAGILLAREHNSFTTGWSTSVGLIYQINERWRTGISWEILSKLSWPSSLYGKDVNEQFPSTVAFGMSALSSLGEWFGEIHYTETKEMSFSRDGITQTPIFSPLDNWTLHLGWRGKLSWWNIPFHIGLFTEHIWTSPFPLRQWSLSLGFKAVGKNVRFAFTWIDNYLFSLLFDDVQPTERGLVSLSYLL